MLPSHVAAGVAAILGAPGSVVEELTPEWAATTRSALVVPGAAGTGATGAARAAEREAVVQWSIRARIADRQAMARRLRLGRDLARVAPWLPVPEVLGGESHGPAPYVVSRFVRGVSGRELLGDDAGAALLGAAVGGMARDIARVPTAGLRLPRTWSDPDRLAAAARRWLEEAGPSVGDVAARRVSSLIERLPEDFGDDRPVFAHGDLAPVNVLMRDGAVVALLDLERARLAHPLFDAAWWRWIVRYHHPERWPAAGEAFLSAAGIARTAATLEQLNVLAALQCLEMFAATPPGWQETRRDWADRLVGVLEWVDSELPG